MAYTFEELKKKRMAELREIAAGLDHEAVQGYTQLNKDHLLQAVCQALGLETHAHHEVVGVDKTKIKAQIKAFKKKRLEAIAGKDSAELAFCRKRIKRLKRTLRRAAV